jgi:hypothetical protein
MSPSFARRPRRGGSGHDRHVAIELKCPGDAGSRRSGTRGRHSSSGAQRHDIVQLVGQYVNLKRSAAAQGSLSVPQRDPASC